ncbi:MAG: alkane 1-monooxygenase [Yoonia sp.]|jgi:alkane 1-monooxygenase
MTVVPKPTIAKLTSALPFWISILLIPLAVFSAMTGGWAVLLLPLCTWYLFSIVDLFAGLNESNADTDTPDNQLYWYRLITMIWAPLQFVTIFGMLYYVTRADHLGGWEQYFLFIGVGVITGTIGINYSHELMHQRPKIERQMGDALLAMVLYSHFRSEHLLVHHRYVGTLRDPVSARFGEGFWRFLLRVLRESYLSAFAAEKSMLARKKLPLHDRRNPFWRFWLMQASFLLLALIIGDVWGLFLFAVQATTAIFQLELVNYLEHYGLTRKHLGNGKYEHVMPRHSWNAAQRASNWLLINLQRHSDHHYKPDRRFPLLQTYGEVDAPQLPYGYPVMTLLALSPTLWRRVMNPRVQKWRAMYYPEITDWEPYRNGSLPLPK